MEFVMTILEGAWRYVTTIRIADYLDIALMAYCCYLLLRLVRSTRAESLVKGIMVFLLALWISHVFKLNGIYFILNHMLDVGILALIVLFQPDQIRHRQPLAVHFKYPLLSGFRADFQNRLRLLQAQLVDRRVQLTHILFQSQRSSGGFQNRQSFLRRIVVQGQRHVQLFLCVLHAVI